MLLKLKDEEEIKYLGTIFYNGKFSLEIFEDNLSSENHI